MVSRDDIVTELREVEKDLRAFVRSRDAIQRRINEMDGEPRQDTFVHWAATQALMNVLVLAIVRCEGLIQDYRTELEKIDAPNVVQLVKETDDEFH